MFRFREYARQHGLDQFGALNLSANL